MLAVVVERAADEVQQFFALRFSPFGKRRVLFPEKVGVARIDPAVRLHMPEGFGGPCAVGKRGEHAGLEIVRDALKDGGGELFGDDFILKKLLRKDAQAVGRAFVKRGEAVFRKRLRARFVAVQIERVQFVP